MFLICSNSEGIQSKQKKIPLKTEYYSLSNCVEKETCSVVQQAVNMGTVT